MNDMKKNAISVALIDKIKTLWLDDIECGRNVELYIKGYNRYVNTQMSGKYRISQNKLSIDDIKDRLRSHMEDVIKIMLTGPHSAAQVPAPRKLQRVIRVEAVPSD